MHDNRPPRRLEYKSPAIAAPATPAPTGRRPGAVRTTAVLGPTDVEHDGSVITTAALVTALRERPVKVAMSHDWNRPVGLAVDVVALGPGDPRLPARDANGRPWPRSGAGVLVSLDLMSSTDDSRVAVKSARAAGPRSAWPFGFRVESSRTHRGARWIDRLSVYTICPPRTGAEVKTAVVPGLEIKGAGGLPVSVQLPTDGRWVYRCGTCGLPSGIADHALPDTARYVCRACVESIGALVDPLPPLPTDGDEPLDGPHPHRVGAESAYRQALDAEQEWSADPVGDLIRRDDDQRWRP